MRITGLFTTAILAAQGCFAIEAITSPRTTAVATSTTSITPTTAPDIELLRRDQWNPWKPLPTTVTDRTSPGKLFTSPAPQATQTCKITPKHPHTGDKVFDFELMGRDWNSQSRQLRWLTNRLKERCHFWRVDVEEFHDSEKAPKDGNGGLWQWRLRADNVNAGMCDDATIKDACKPRCGAACDKPMRCLLESVLIAGGRNAKPENRWDLTQGLCQVMDGVDKKKDPCCDDLCSDECCDECKE